MSDMDPENQSGDAENPAKMTPLEAGFSKRAKIEAAEAAVIAKAKRAAQARQYRILEGSSVIFFDAVLLFLVASHTRYYHLPGTLNHPVPLNGGDSHELGTTCSLWIPLLMSLVAGCLAIAGGTVKPSHIKYIFGNPAAVVSVCAAAANLVANFFFLFFSLELHTLNAEECGASSASESGDRCDGLEALQLTAVILQVLLSVMLFDSCYIILSGNVAEQSVAEMGKKAQQEEHSQEMFETENAIFEERKLFEDEINGQGLNTHGKMTGDNHKVCHDSRSQAADLLEPEQKHTKATGDTFVMLTEKELRMNWQCIPCGAQNLGQVDRKRCKVCEVPRPLKRKVMGGESGD